MGPPLSVALVLRFGRAEEVSRHVGLEEWPDGLLSPGSDADGLGFDVMFRFVRLGMVQPDLIGCIQVATTHQCYLL